MVMGNRSTATAAGVYERVVLEWRRRLISLENETHLIPDPMMWNMAMVSLDFMLSGYLSLLKKA